MQNRIFWTWSSARLKPLPGLAPPQNVPRCPRRGVLEAGPGFTVESVGVIFFALEQWVAAGGLPLSGQVELAVFGPVMIRPESRLLLLSVSAAHQESLIQGCETRPMHRAKISVAELKESNRSKRVDLDKSPRARGSSSPPRLTALSHSCFARFFFAILILIPIPLRSSRAWLRACGAGAEGARGLGMARPPGAWTAAPLKTLNTPVFNI